MSEDPRGPTLPTELAAELSAVADRLDAPASANGSTFSWERGDVTFAIVAGGVAEFRLDQTIAAAARRTPDTSGSDRGPDWVRFAPRDLDDHALDRARAWFEAAHRRAG